MLPGSAQQLPPEPPGAVAAWVALMFGVGSLLPTAALVMVVLLGGSMDIGTAATLFLLGPVLGITALVAAVVASARAERWGTRLPRRRLPIAVCSGLLGTAASVAWLMLLLDGVPRT